MHFLDDSLFPENQEKLVITAAPYGPEWEPADFPEDIPLTMDQHVQQAVDCWEAGATVLHIHVRELDGKGSKRMSQFNELLRRAYKDREPIFDLAVFESTLPNGERVQHDLHGRAVASLAPAYTDDGGHLNAAARVAIARRLVAAIARLGDPA